MSESKGPVTIMKGGTLSSREERNIQAFMLDTRERQKARDEERELAMRHRVSADETGGAGFAAETVHDLGQPGTSPVAFVGYKTGRGDEVQYMQLDVIAMTDNLGAIDETFVFVCPRCIERGYRSTMAQIHVRKSNRKWELDTRSQGELFIDENSGKAYRLAGRVICEERCRCPMPSCDGVYTFGDWGPLDISARPHTSCMRRV